MTFRKCLFSLLFASLVLVLSFGTVSAQYQISENDLTQLEISLNKLNSINSQLTSDLIKSRQELVIVRTELAQVQKELLLLNEESIQAKLDLKKASESLATANRSLEELKKDVQSETRSLKMQRTVLGVAIAYLIIKR